MKKLTVLLSLIICYSLTQSLYSQDDKTKKGIKVGLNSATLFGDDVEDNDPVLDFHLGSFWRISPVERFSIQIEFLYTRQGTEFDGDRLALNYFSLPIMARLNFIDGKLGLYAGPQVAYLIGISADNEPEGYELRDLYKDYDLSGVIGAEADLFAGLLVGARYNFSIAYIGSGDEITYDSPPLGNISFTAPEEIGNAVFQIYLGFAF